jgi:membrane protein YqaA with SNARE-associated domain
MLRHLYDWTLSLAARPSAPYALGTVSFAESSFFPVPPDVMLVPMALARPDRAWTYALICTVTSVAGGILGYVIGALLYESVGAWVFRLYGLTESAESFRASYAQYGHWIILLKGLTPIPYKLVTITSGFAGYDLFWFVALSILTRGRASSCSPPCWGGSGRSSATCSTGTSMPPSPSLASRSSADS